MLQLIGGEPPRAIPEIKRTLCKFFLTSTCDRGNQCTWAHGEHELGEPIGAFLEEQDLFQDHGMHVGFAGDPSMGPNAKRTICKFWQQGICNRGLECTFAHGLEDMQVDVQESLFDDFPPNLAGGAHGAPTPAGTKRTICKFWEEGNCTKGDVCTFAHGHNEIGEPIFEHFEHFEHFEPVLQGHGAPIGAPPTNVKRTICKFWEQGTCTRGAECTWAHGEEDLGVAPVVVEPEPIRAVPRKTIPSYVPAGKSGKGVIGKSLHGQKTVFQSQPIERFEEHRFIPEAPAKGKGGKGRDLRDTFSPFGFEGQGAVEQPVKKTLCKFWLEGQCSRGQSCTWAHGVEDKAVPAHVALGGIPSGPPAATGPAEVRRTICKFWQQGKCTQAAGQCTWAHGEWEIGTQVGTLSNGGGYKGGSVFKRPRLTH